MGPLTAQGDIRLTQVPVHTSRPVREWMVVGAALAAAFVSDPAIRSAMRDPDDHHTGLTMAGNALGNPVVVAPVLVGSLALGLVVRSPGLRTAATHALASGVVASAIVVGAKLAFGRGRPDDTGDPGTWRPFSGMESFPSGHTAVSAAVASALAHHTRSTTLRVAAYGAIALTGVARMRDDRHWLSDVVAGFAVGRLSASLVERAAHHRMSPTLSSDGIGISFIF